MSWLAGAPADCAVFGLVAPWLGPPERSSPAAAQRCAAGAGLDGAGQGQASLPPSRTTTRSDTVWLLKSRLLHISHAVWLYFRFPLSLRMVEDLLTARGILVSHESVRQ